MRIMLALPRLRAANARSASMSDQSQPGTCGSPVTPVSQTTPAIEALGNMMENDQSAHFASAVRDTFTEFCDVLRALLRDRSLPLPLLSQGRSGDCNCEAERDPGKLPDVCCHNKANVSAECQTALATHGPGSGMGRGTGGQQK